MQVRPIVVEEADDTDVGMSVVVRLAVQHRLRGHTGSEECQHGDGDDSSNPAHDGLPRPRGASPLQTGCSTAEAAANARAQPTNTAVRRATNQVVQEITSSRNWTSAPNN